MHLNPGINPDVAAPPCSCKRGHKRFGRCRKSRPLCRVMRSKIKGYYCSCDGYHYRHRRGSALCESNPSAVERRNRLLYGDS